MNKEGKRILRKVGNLKDILKGKKIASVDFGFKRLGVAVSDVLHISITPLKVFDFTSAKFWDEFVFFLQREKIDAIVVGYPFREDGKENEVAKAIDEFIDILNQKVDLPIFKFDESFSTKRAEKLMIELGKKKKERRKKENKDLISAALILRDFIEINNL